MEKITDETEVFFCEDFHNTVADCDAETKTAIYKIEKCLPDCCDNCLFYIKKDGFVNIEIISNHEGHGFYVGNILSIVFVLDVSEEDLRKVILEDFIEGRELLFIKDENGKIILLG